jgi:uncharacterized protein (DUF697 family)
MSERLSWWRTRAWLRSSKALRDALLNPTVELERLDEVQRQARARQPTPVLWLLGKTQSGKTSIIRALTGSPAAEIGNGFQPCTHTARIYDFPQEVPVVRFLDTRGLGEVAYDPTDDIRYCEEQAHLVIAVMKAADIHQESAAEALRAIRRRHPDWPAVIAQTALHEVEGYGGDHVQPHPYADLDRGLPPEVPAPVVRVLDAQRQRVGALPGAAPPAWVPVDLTLAEDGWAPVDYGLEALWAAIERTTHLKLKAFLQADPAVQDAYARAEHPHIVGYGLAAGAVGALPLIDLVGVPALQAKLLHTVASLYRQGGNGRTVSKFLGLLGVSTGAGYAARLLGQGLVKLIPGWGQTAGALWGATASAATTFALGKAAAFYFATRRCDGMVDAEALRRVYADALQRGAQFLSMRTEASP